MKWNLKSASPLLLVLLGGLAQATTVQPLTFEEQVKKAELIMHVKITEVKVIQDRNDSWQQYSFSVQETFKGDPKTLTQVSGTPTFKVLGGGDWQMEGAPLFQKDQEWMLLLYKTQYDSPVVGFNQGMYQIRSGRIEGADSLKLKDDQLSTFKTHLREKL